MDTCQPVIPSRLFNQRADSLNSNSATHSEWNQFSKKNTVNTFSHSDLVHDFFKKTTIIQPRYSFLILLQTDHTSSPPRKNSHSISWCLLVQSQSEPILSRASGFTARAHVLFLMSCLQRALALRWREWCRRGRLCLCRSRHHAILMRALKSHLYFLVHRPPLTAQVQGAISLPQHGEGANTDLFSSQGSKFLAH